MSTSRECEKPAEWDVRMPITCRRLNTVFSRPPASAQSGGANGHRLVGRPFESAEALRAATVAAGIAAADLPALFAAALEPDSPKKGLLHSGGRPGPSISLAIGARNPLALDALYGAGLENWADGANLPAGAVALVDPARGLVQLVSDPTPAGLTVHLVHYGILSPVGAGTDERGDRVPDGVNPADHFHESRLLQPERRPEARQQSDLHPHYRRVTHQRQRRFPSVGG